MAGLTPYAYKAGNSFLHRLPARVKLLCLLVISGSAFVFFPFGVGFSFAFIAAASCTAAIPLRSLYRGSGFIVFMAITMIIFRSLSWEPLGFTIAGFREGLGFALGLLAAFAGCALFFSVTTMQELKESLDSLRPPNPALARLISRFTVGVTLMLGFMPRFFEIWEDAETAYKARAGKNGARKLVFLTGVAIERMIQLAVETAVALDMRGFEQSDALFLQRGKTSA
ncbi:MAG: energy-coupling factor transporter transmembrane protein EcfT [Treponema sp.]|jgi:energy-coupling factor transporter transmembrane protein EcfT|nr:energy-coupling factor transporter transmembrane protein EcfT [Treponema sp.]